MTLIPEELVMWQVKDAVNRGAPHILVALQGTHGYSVKFMEDLAAYLTKKGFLVKLRMQRASITLLQSGQVIRFAHFWDEGDVRPAHQHAGWEYQVMVTNLAMTFDANHAYDPVMYLMSRIRKPYEEHSE